MASFWNGTSGAKLTQVANRFAPQTGQPQTGTPNTNPQAGFPITTGGASGQATNANPRGAGAMGAPGGAAGGGGRGAGAMGAMGNPASGMGGGTGAWERSRSSGFTPGQTDSAPFGASGGGGRGAGAMGAMGNPAAGMGGPPSISQFSASDNLIGSQFNPTPGAQTQGAMDATNGALSQYMGQPLGGQYGAITPGRSADTQQLQGYAMGAAGNYAGAGGPPSLTNPAFQGVGANTYGQSQGYLSQLLGGAGGQASGGSFGYGGDTGQARSLMMQQLQKTLGDTPDRAALASSAYDRLVKESTPQFEQDLRNTNRKSAAMGWGGSGMATADLGTVQQRREEQLAARRAELADNAASQSLADQQAKLSAAQGAATSLGGMDTAAGSLNLGYLNASNSAIGQNNDSRYRAAMGLADLQSQGRNEAVSERDKAYQAGRDANDLAMTLDNTRFSRLQNQAMDLGALQNQGLANDRALQNDQRTERDFFANQDQQRFNNSRSRFQDLSNYQTNRENSDYNRLDFLRGERSYQQGLDQQAIDNNLRERMAQEDLLNSRFGRGMQLSQFGYGNDPTSAMFANAGMYGQQGQQYGQQASDAWGGAADAVTNWAYNRQRARPSQPSQTNATMDQWRNYGF